MSRSPNTCPNIYLRIFGVNLVALLITQGPLSVPSEAAETNKNTEAHSSRIPSKYDEQIRSYVHRYWTDYPDWLDWKAQLYQESRLDPNATSSVGAQGLAQFMPGTWEDISKALGYGTLSRRQAEPAIAGGAYYMATLRRTWRGRSRTSDQQQWLGQASYNAGVGSLLKAQRFCGDALTWDEIAVCMPQVTGQEFSTQTINYVRMIAHWRSQL